jgi:hypothetical protein
VLRSIVGSTRGRAIRAFFVISVLSKGLTVGSVIKKRRKRMAKKKHRKLLRKTRHQRRNKK